MTKYLARKVSADKRERWRLPLQPPPLPQVFSLWQANPGRKRTGATSGTVSVDTVSVDTVSVDTVSVDTVKGREGWEGTARAGRGD